jgi:hypothetical protein
LKDAILRPGEDVNVRDLNAEGLEDILEDLRVRAEPTFAPLGQARDRGLIRQGSLDMDNPRLRIEIAPLEPAGRISLVRGSRKRTYQIGRPLLGCT